MATLDEQKESLLNSAEVSAALNKAADIKQDLVTSYKDQRKANYSRFYEIVFQSREDIQSILNKKKKNRTEAEIAQVKKFNQETKRAYKLISDFRGETPEEGEQSKLEKAVEKIALIVKMMRYIGDVKLDEAFKKYGISLTCSDLKNDSVVFDNDATQENMKDIFDCSVKLANTVAQQNETITDEIYTQDVPSELIYDKDANPTGIKVGDFKKLVDIQMKMNMASSDIEKNKLSEKVETLAGNKEFDNARNQLIQEKLLDMEQKFRTEDEEE